MSADLDGDVAPVRIKNMKGVVVDLGHRLFAFQMTGSSDLPNRSLGATHQDEKQSPGDLGLGEIILGNVVFSFPTGAVNDRNTVGFGIAAKTTTETTGQAHQMGVVQGVIGPGQGSPPDMESARRMPHTEVRTQNDPIYAIVAAGEKILVKVTESICHSGTLWAFPWPVQPHSGFLAWLLAFAAPKGPLFRSPICEKA